ncbi:MAG TPA: GNAT family N-acetyltransferase [Phycisphaerae bacterium]|nr:GNAT family N-acetyltransferase [Phycisphaerae bacterium]
MDRLHLRRVRLEDVPELVQIHEGSDDPWADPVECALWVNHRLLRPFYGDVAVASGRVVGHAEWIVSNEPQPLGRQLYLGMLQVHPQHRTSGVGRAMIEHGLARARKLSCGRVGTIAEEGSEGFYERCGFHPELRTATYSLPLSGSRLPTGWQRAARVPERVVELFPMRVGWVQGCSAHMWEVCNRWVRIAGDKVRHICARRRDGQAYVQLRYLGAGDAAMALAWAPAEFDLPAMMAAATGLARPLPVTSLTITVLQNESAQMAVQGTLVGEDTVWATDPNRPAAHSQ